MNGNEWPNIIRIVHLSGGIRAINNPGSIVSVTPTLKDSDISFEIPSYNSLVATLKKKILSCPFGIDFYRIPEEIGGLYPPYWRSVTLTHRAIDTWRQLFNSGHSEKDYEFAEISSKIAFQLKAIEYRLREISESYHSELSAVCAKKEFKEGNGIESPNSYPIYLSVHSFLIDACILRDYLSEFLSIYHYGKYKKVDSLSALLKDVIKKKKIDDRISKVIFEITDEKNPFGWLSKLTAYRNLVVHNIPLIYSEGRTYVLLVKNKIAKNVEIPSILFPLPKDPHKIRNLRSKNELYKDFGNWKSSILKNPLDDKIIHDALSYCYLFLMRISEFALDIATSSPYKPSQPNITEKDIIGEVQIKRQDFANIPGEPDGQELGGLR